MPWSHVRIWCSEDSCHSSGCESHRQNSSSDCRSYIQQREGRPTRGKPGSKSPCGWEKSWSDPSRGASNLTGRSEGEPVSPEIRALLETDGRINERAELLRSWRRPMSELEELDEHGSDLSGDIGGGMPGRNGQRKLGTTRGSPRRSRTAKASRISRRAAKSRCACEWGGWGR